MITSNFRAGLTILIFVLIVYSVFIAATNQYTRLTADSALYVSIAEKYLEGDFKNAINGYWGPLLAWLLIPFLYFGTEDVVAINVLNLIFGILTIIGIWLLSYRFGISEKTRSVVIISSLPIVLKFSLVQPMDFLLVCIFVFYLSIIFNSDYSKGMSNGIFSGILGAVAYFTKAYAFPFFIVHFFVMNIFHYFKQVNRVDKRNILRNTVAGFILFFLISGTWIMLISDKYGYYTFSTMRRTNFNAPGPEARGRGLEFDVPVFYEGFFKPPNETAFVIWEDPSYLEGKKWRPWDSWVHFKHFIKLLLKNISEGLYIFESFSTLSVAIVITYILLLSVQIRNKIFFQGELIYPLFTVILYSGGFLLFHFEDRYLWLVNILLLLMGGYVLDVLFQNEFFKNNMRKGILIIFFIISFVLLPSRFVIQASSGGMDKEMYYLSAELKKYNIHGNIASNREHIPVHDAWHKTFRLAYWLKSRYYGQAGEGIDDKDLENELRKYDIDYYFLWGDPKDAPEFLSQYRELTRDEMPGLKIYSLKEKK